MSEQGESVKVGLARANGTDTYGFRNGRQLR